MYHLIDSHTGKLIKSYEEAKYARKQRDRLDSKYGAVRYVVKFVEKE